MIRKDSNIRQPPGPNVQAIPINRQRPKTIVPTILKYINSRQSMIRTLPINSL